MGTATRSYSVAVKARGGVFLLSLPGNTNLGESVRGSPGARIPDWSAKSGWHYEQAPLAVRAEQGWERLREWDDKLLSGPVRAVDDAIAPVLRATGADAPLGAIAQGLKISMVTATVLTALVVYLILRNAGLVPSLNRVLK